MSHVVQVVREAETRLFIRLRTNVARFVELMCLCPARDARGHCGAQLVVRDLLRETFRDTENMAAWTNERQVALENIEALRKLVDTGLAQECANVGDNILRLLAHVTIHHECATDCIVCSHGAQLVYLDTFAVLADTLLSDECRPGALKLNCKCNEGDEGEESCEEYCASDNVDDALADRVRDGVAFGAVIGNPVALNSCERDTVEGFFVHCLEVTHAREVLCGEVAVDCGEGVLCVEEGGIDDDEVDILVCDDLAEGIRTRYLAHIFLGIDMVHE